jgi:hypothetical protein
MTLTDIFNILNGVLEGKVFYGTNVYDNETQVELPYIVYQEISSRPMTHVDNKAIYYKGVLQITLVTKKKDVSLETKLQNALLEAGFSYSLTSEYINMDKSVSRAYEITMEEI